MKRLLVMVACLIWTVAVWAGPVLGTKQIAVMGVVWPDYPTAPFAMSQIANEVHNIFAANYEAQSYGQVDIISGAVVEWVMMPRSLSDPYYGLQSGAGGLMYSLGNSVALLDLDLRATANAHIDMVANQHVVIVAAGLGDCAHVVDDGSGKYSVFSGGGLCGMLPGTPTPLKLLLHEVGGHALPDLAPYVGGLLHSGTADCLGTGTWYPPNLCGAQPCVNSVYGDWLDPMGVASTAFNTKNKIELGWVPTDAMIIAGSGQHTYAINSIDGPTNTGYLGIRIDLPESFGTDYYYLIENRASGAYIREIQIWPSSDLCDNSQVNSFLLKLTNSQDQNAIPLNTWLIDNPRSISIYLQSRTTASATFIVQTPGGGGGGPGCPPACQQ